MSTERDPGPLVAKLERTFLDEMLVAARRAQETGQDQFAGMILGLSVLVKAETNAKDPCPLCGPGRTCGQC